MAEISEAGLAGNGLAKFSLVWSDQAEPSMVKLVKWCPAKYSPVQ